MRWPFVLRITMEKALVEAAGERARDRAVAKHALKQAQWRVDMNRTPDNLAARNLVAIALLRLGLEDA